jgi:hypothetical protein
MDKIIEAVRGGKLQIDFISLTLVQNTTDNPIEYRGTGYIRQTDDDAPRRSVRLIVPGPKMKGKHHADAHMANICRLFPCGLRGWDRVVARKLGGRVSIKGDLDTLNPSS